MWVTFLPVYDMKYKLGYIRKWPEVFKAIIGPDIMDLISITSIGSLSYIHPMTLMGLLGFAVLLPSGVIVGQIDRGTIDLVLATPLSRRKFMATTILTGCLGGAILVGAMLLGTWIGIQHTAGELAEPYQYGRIVTCAINLYTVYLVALGYSTFFSAISTIRGWAVGFGCAMGIVVYLLHFLSEWWELVRKISFLGPLYYYRPIKIVTGHYDPTGNMLLLTGAAAALLLLGTVCFTRRNIAVV